MYKYLFILLFAGCMSPTAPSNIGTWTGRGSFGSNFDTTITFTLNLNLSGSVNGYLFTGHYSDSMQNVVICSFDEQDSFRFGTPEDRFFGLKDTEVIEPFSRCTPFVNAEVWK